jgi:hypothetical protein
MVFGGYLTRVSGVPGLTTQTWVVFWAHATKGELMSFQTEQARRMADRARNASPEELGEYLDYMVELVESAEKTARMMERIMRRERQVRRSTPAEFLDESREYLIRVVESGRQHD